MHQPESKPSATYKVGPRNLRILPPDFLYNEIRSVSQTNRRQRLRDLFRVIGSGIPGTAMPAWFGALDKENKDLWAMIHYVNSLIEMRDTREASALLTRLNNAAPFHPPAETQPKKAATANVTSVTHELLASSQ